MDEYQSEDIMKKLIQGFFWALAVAAWVAFLVPAVTAHPTGNERRTAAECKALKKPAKRAACLNCVTRPKPHHYHPFAAVGKRCRPSNGKP